MTDSHSFVCCPECDAQVRLPLDPGELPVRCPRCQAPLSALETVDDPAAVRTVVSADRSPNQDDYPLATGTGQPLPTTTRYIAVTCAVCGTRLHATEEQIGQSLPCHDCGRSTIVRAPKRVSVRKPNVSDDEPPLVLGAIAKRVDYELPAAGHRAGQAIADDDDADRQPGSESPLPVGPRTLLQGVWSIPWQRECWRQWLVFSVWLMLLALMGILAVAMFLVPARGFASVGPWILAAGMIVATLVFGSLWAVFFSVRLVAIVVDTAAGSRRIVNWPDALFLDSVPDALYVLLAAAVVAIPASVFAWLIQPAPLGWGAASLVFLLLFPVVHLSMLERGSKLVPLSPLVLASVRRVTWAWLIALVESGLLVAAVVALIASGYWAIGLWVVLPAAALVTAALMIYFRLLGRLAWCCATALNELGAERQEPAMVSREEAAALPSTNQVLE